MTHDDRHVIRLVKVQGKVEVPPPVEVAEVETEPSFEIPKKPRRNRTFLIVTVVLGVMLTACVALVFFSVFKSEPKEAVSAESQMGEEEVLSKVKTLMLVPDEKPAMAIVSDLEPLKGQAFFAKAKLGDVVLMFVQSSKAVLYRPSDNKIIESGPLNTK